MLIIIVSFVILMVHWMILGLIIYCFLKLFYVLKNMKNKELFLKTVLCSKNKENKENIFGFQFFLF